MKHFILFSLCFTLFATAAYSQEDTPMYDDVTVVFSQNKCYAEHISDLVDMTRDLTGPIMNDVVAAGHWINWGVLQHSWGDEWNFNNFYAAKDRASFFKGWDMFVATVSEKHPDAFKIWQQYCFEHKDNIYHQSLGLGFSLEKKAAEEE
jgi:hypothetical protein